MPDIWKLHSGFNHIQVNHMVQGIMSDGGEFLMYVILNVMTFILFL